MLYLEGPTGVGFSYSDPRKDATGDMRVNHAFVMQSRTAFERPHSSRQLRISSMQSRISLTTLDQTCNPTHSSSPVSQLTQQCLGWGSEILGNQGESYGAVYIAMTTSLIVDAKKTQPPTFSGNLQVWFKAMLSNLLTGNVFSWHRAWR